MAIALDLGSHTFRSLRLEGTELKARSCHTVYSVLPALEANCRLLEKSDIAYAICDGQIILMGDEAAQLSPLFQKSAVPVLADGKIPKNDPLARQVLATMIKSLLPANPPSGDLCCLTAPKMTPSGNDGDLTFFSKVVQLEGYRPVFLNESMALVLAELGHQGFTGLGLTFGASHCEATLAHQGKTIDFCKIPRGGNWIDEQLAQATDSFVRDKQENLCLNVDGVREQKEASSKSILNPQSKFEHELSGIYRALVNDILHRAAKLFALSERTHLLPQPMTVVCGGAVTMVPGFTELVRDVLNSLEFPVQIASVSVSDDPDFGVARGCLIHAELESSTLHSRVA